jgi:hypothetical protein
MMLISIMAKGELLNERQRVGNPEPPYPLRG